MANFKIKKATKVLVQKGKKEFLLKFADAVLHFLPPRFYHRIPEYVFRRFLVGHAIERVNGFRMFLDLGNDLGISKDLFFYRKREFRSTDYVLKSGIIEKENTVLDIGGNIGYYVLIESQLVGRKGKVYVLEPQSTRLEILKRNLSLNKIENVEYYELAAGDENKTACMNISRKKNLSSFTRQYEVVERVKKEMVRVDDFLKDKQVPSFVRMDVEGFAYKIIRGMKNTLRDKRLKNLLIELHPHLKPPGEMEKIFEILKESGFYRVNHIVEINPEILNSKGKIRPSIRLINNLRGHEIDKQFLVDKVETMSCDDLLKRLKKGYGAHAHFIKDN